VEDVAEDDGKDDGATDAKADTTGDLVAARETEAAASVLLSCRDGHGSAVDGAVIDAHVDVVGTERVVKQVK
jgi:hypothetical protein